MTYKTFLEALEDRYLLAVTSSAAEPIAARMSSATLSLAAPSDHVLPGVDQPIVPVNRAPDHNAGWLGTASAMEPPPIPAAVAPAPDPGRQFASDLLFSHFVTNHESFANGAVFAPQFVAQSLREASSRPAMSLTGALLEFDAGTILIRYLSPSMEGASALRKESAARSLGTARNTGTALEQLVTLAAVAPVASENGSTAVAQPSGVDRGALLATVAQTLQELNYGALHAFENAGDQSLARQSALALESALNSPSAVATNLFATAAGAALKNSSGHAGWPPAAAERQEAKVGLGLALPLPQGASLLSAALAVEVVALEEAAQALLAPALTSGRKECLYWIGVSSWLLAVLAAGEAARQRHQQPNYCASLARLCQEALAEGPR